MKAYKVLAEVTTRYTIEVHGEDEDAVYDNVELMGPSQVMEGGEFDSTVDVACISVELMHPEDYDEPDVVEQMDKELGAGDPDEVVELSPEDQADLDDAVDALAEPEPADDDLYDYENEEETDEQEENAPVSD